MSKEFLYKEERTRSRERVVDDLPINGIFRLEDIFSHHARHMVLRLLNIVLVLSFLLCVASALLLFSSGDVGILVKLQFGLTENGLRLIIQKAGGIFFLGFFFWLFVYVLEAFHRSLYFHNREHKAQKTNRRDRVVSEVVEYFYREKSGDILKAFLRSDVGHEVTLRLGIVSDDVKGFLKNRVDVQRTHFYEIKEKGITTREDLGEYLFDKHEEFSDFLFQHSIPKEEFIGALAWAVKLDLYVKFRERWWSKWRLRKIPSFGKEWAYGGAYVLERYGEAISVTLGEEHSTDYLERRAKYVKNIEETLSKTMEANVLLVGDDGVGKIELIRDLARRMMTAAVPKGLISHRLIRLRTDFLIGTTKEKTQFELEFINVLHDANNAGNVVLVFNDFVGFLQSAEAIGSDALRLLGKFLANSEMKVIALSGSEKYHQFLETNPLIANRFNIIKVEEPGFGTVVGALEDYVPSLEREHDVLFTYPALLEVARSAKYYITEGVMPDKALDLLVEVAPFAFERDTPYITREVVQRYVSKKTNIPMGEITPEEKEKLETLEPRLHELVVGQEHAITQLSDALRRSRAGIRDLERPVGSFLFLGPTGVGKTQTAKAIAEVFFGDSEALSRLDMSEYSGSRALEQLTGSFDSGQVGILTKLIKSRPYGVLLLDEFEKADRKVHDLFLQILDEGFFTDMGGRKVNARNLIFIATSNAGSDMIWKAAEEGIDTSKIKDELTKYVIDAGIYRPEFLNRFDDVVVFHPLSRDQLHEIAKIMLQGTKTRIKQKGYELVINEPLVEYVTRIGYDPTFGARPMARAIKDTVEQVIAKKIISGSLRAGDRVELGEEDFS